MRARIFSTPITGILLAKTGVTNVVKTDQEVSTQANRAQPGLAVAVTSAFDHSPSAPFGVGAFLRGLLCQFGVVFPGVKAAIIVFQSGLVGLVIGQHHNRPPIGREVAFFSRHRRLI